MLFHCMEALGNNFVLIDCVTQKVKTLNNIVALLKSSEECLDFDQVLAIHPPKTKEADFDLEIYNLDGSKAENCVNGLRCVGKYLIEEKIALCDDITISVMNKTFKVSKIKDLYSVESDFSLISGDIGLSGKETNLDLDFHKKKVKVFSVSVGNPHGVIFNDNYDLDVEDFGSFLQKSGIYSKGVNVGFVKVINEKEISLRVFERGVGETQACGSGACAASIICSLENKTSDEIEVNFYQGSVNTKVDRKRSKIKLTGDAVYRKRNIETIF